MRQGPDPRPMIKGWLTQLVRALRQAAPEACAQIDFPLGVEVTGRESTRWILELAGGRVETRTKDEVPVTFIVADLELQRLVRQMRPDAWKKAFESKRIEVSAEDAARLEKLRTLADALLTRPPA